MQQVCRGARNRAQVSLTLLGCWSPSTAKNIYILQKQLQSASPSSSPKAATPWSHCMHAGMWLVTRTGSQSIRVTKCPEPSRGASWFATKLEENKTGN